MSHVTDLLTVGELATALRVPVSTVYAWTATQQVPHLKIGRHLRFRLDDVLAWFEAKTAQTNRIACHRTRIALTPKAIRRSLTIRREETGPAHPSTQEE